MLDRRAQRLQGDAAHPADPLGAAGEVEHQRRGRDLHALGMHVVLRVRDTPVAEIIAAHREYAKLPDITIACNRVTRRYERSLGREWRNGVFTAVSAALVGIGIVWMVMR